MENTERRVARRYPVEAEVQCRALSREAGSNLFGRLVNLSQTGLLMECNPQELTPSQPVEIMVRWPGSSRVATGLHLRAVGQIVRLTPNRMAVRIEQSAFQFAGAVRAQ